MYIVGIVSHKGKRSSFMRTLYHHWLIPECRKIRIILAEKKLEFKLVLENTWSQRDAFLALNPAGQVPVLEDVGLNVLADSNAISEYLEEAYPEHCLIKGDLLQRAEIRRLNGWFDHKFNQEVTQCIVFEKIFKRFHGKAHPDTQIIRLGLQNLNNHLSYINWLVERRHWLAGDEFSLADITAASHLSAVDYLGHVSWDKHIEAKEWYARVKSRPSFRGILNDTIPGIICSAHYRDLDF
jgi:glutathione S-transferase